MSSRIVKRWLSVLLVLSMLFSMSVSAFAAEPDTNVSVTAVDSTYGSAVVEFPSEWTAGRNTFDVTSQYPCLAMVVRADGTEERLYCAIVDETTGHHRFQVNAAEGDSVYVAVKGDTDLDGVVAITDMARINQSLVGLTGLSVIQHWVSDVDVDDTVSITDMARINQYLVGLYNWTWDIGWVIEDEPDVPPVDPSDPDSDGDGIVDSLDPDDNNDGVLDLDDPDHPDYDPDTDGDGMRDSLDKDDDGDGIPDEQDPDHPDYVKPDTDGDGIPDDEDDDDDGDGIPDVDDSDHPDYAEPEDPNLDAVMTLSADVNEIHIGDDVAFTLSYDIEGEFELNYLLTVGIASSDLDVSGLTETGGVLTFDEKVGSYTLLAVAVTESGVTVESNAVTVSVTNTAPVVKGISTKLTYEDNTSGYVEGAKIRVDITVDAEDADGDTYELKYVTGDNYISADGTYLDEGMYTIGVYAVDQWGAKSDTVYYPVEVSYLDTVPVIYTDSEVVHIGETFNVYVNEDVLEDKISRWTLYDADGNIVAFDQSNMTKSGGTMCVEDGTGIYVLHAIGIDEYGVEFDMETLTIGVENNRPGTATMTHTVVENQFMDAFTENAKVYVTFEATGIDPDGDDTTVYVVNDAGDDYVPADGYYAEGTHTLTIYCVDEWGLVGDETTYTFTVENTKPDAPMYAVDINYDDWKYVDGELAVYVEISAEASDPDGNPIDIKYTDSSSLSGYYTTGQYEISGYTVDAWLAESAVSSHTFDINLETTSMTINGEPSEITVHIGDDFEVSTSVGAYSVNWVSYVLTDAAGNKVGQVGNSLTATGGTMSITNGVGDYTLTATAMLTDGTVVPVGEVLIHVVNEAPLAPSVTVFVDYSKATSLSDTGHFGELGAYTTISYKTTDPDGDEFTWVPVEDTDKYVTKNDYLVDGTYTVWAQAVDEWGAKSEPVEYVFTVQFTEFPSISPTDVSVHLGEEFAVSVQHGTLDVYKMEYKITDENGVTEIYSDLGLYGGLMSINTAKGEYTMRAVAKLQDGSLYEIGVVNIHVANAAPVVAVNGHDVLDNTNGDLRVAFDVSHSEPDGDAYTVYYTLDNGRYEVLSGDLELACKAGEHVLTVYAVDEWGAESEVVNYEFAVASYLDKNTQPEVTYDVTNRFKGGYTTNATRYVDFNVDWMLNDTEVGLDLDTCVIYYKVNNEFVNALDGYYALGTYNVEVYAVDILGTETKHGTCTMVLTNETPVVDIWTEEGYVVESVSDDEVFYKVERFADGYPIDSYDVLEPGTYELTLTATDIWGAVGTVTKTLTIAAQPPVLRIDGHTVTDRDTDEHLAYVEFDFVALNYNADEYTLYYKVDGKADTGLDDWFTLEEHTVEVYAKHNTLPDRVSNTVVYTFDLTNHAPDVPVIDHEVDRTDFMNEYTNSASVWTSFFVNATDPDGDDVVIYWMNNGEVVDSVDGYMKAGVHYVEAYAVDVWGQKSEVAEYTFTIANEAPVVNSVTHKVNSNLTKTDVDGRSMVWVDIIPTITDANGDNYKVTMTLNGEEFGGSDYLAIGSYTVSVEAVDVWNKTSSVYDYTFSLTNQPPTAPEVTYVIDESTIQNAYTTNATALLDLSATSTDPDGDDITIYWEVNAVNYTGENITAGAGNGDMLVYTWAVDSYGNKSPETVTTISLKSDVPSTSTTWDINYAKSTGAFTENAKAYVVFDTTVVDSDDCKLFYSKDGVNFTEDGLNGLYTSDKHLVYVYAVDIWGNKSPVEQVVVNLTNHAPEKPVISYTAQRDTLINAYTEDAAFYVDFEATSSDPDGDRYIIYYTFDGGVETENIDNYYGCGVYPVTAYAVDFWGAKSEVATKDYVASNNAPSVTAADFSEFTSDDIVNPYTVNAYVPVSVIARAKDVDGDMYKLTCTLNGKTVSADEVFNLTVGTYTIEVQAIDAFGAASAKKAVTITVGSAAPEISNITHVLGDTFQNAYTTSAKRLVTIKPTVTDPDGDTYKVYTQVNGVDTGTASGYYGLGTQSVMLRAIDIWGMASPYFNYEFEMTNEAPDKPGVEGVIDWTKVTDPYTTSAKVYVDVVETTSDPDNDVLKTYYSVNGGSYSDTSSFADGYYGAGKYDIKAYSLDPWGEKSETLEYTFEINSEIDVSIVKPSVFGSGYTTSGNTAAFTANVTAQTPYKFAWLDFYEAGKPVTLNGYDLTGTSQNISKTSWISGNHMLIVQAMNILGQADYDTFYFMTGVSGTGGSVSITGTGATTGTPELVDDEGNVLSYVSGFTVNSPTISGHSSGNSDYLLVVGIDKNGNKTTICKPTSSHALVTISCVDGVGTWTSDGSPSSGNFTMDTNKYVSLSFTFYSPHSSCLTSGGTSMTYTVTYGFANNDTSLDNMAQLFAGV